MDTSRIDVIAVGTCFVSIVFDDKTFSGRNAMDGFWSIVRGWDKLGQFIFLLIVLGGIGTLIQKVAYYSVVSIRGWPPVEQHLQESEEQDG